MCRDGFSSLCIKLQKLRDRHGETLHRMASRLSIKSSDLSDIENGLQPVPADFVEKLHSRYGLTSTELIEFQQAVLDDELNGTGYPNKPLKLLLATASQVKRRR